MAKLIFNGKETDLAEGEDLLSFLQSRDLGGKNLILDWNGQILTEQDRLETCIPKDGDTLDLFSMVGGG